MSVDFLELLQGCSLLTLLDIRSSNFLIATSIAGIRDVVLGDRNSSWIFIKNLNEGVLHICQEPAKFSLTSVVIPRPNSLVIS
jgi:hypothetical protein